MSSQGSLHREIARSGKYPLWNCPLGKCQPEIRLCMGKCHSGNCPDTNLSVKLSQRAAIFAIFKRIIQNAVKYYQRDLLKVSVLKRY